MRNENPSVYPNGLSVIEPRRRQYRALSLPIHHPDVWYFHSDFINGFAPNFTGAPSPTFTPTATCPTGAATSTTASASAFDTAQMYFNAGTMGIVAGKQFTWDARVQIGINSGVANIETWAIGIGSVQTGANFWSAINTPAVDNCILIAHLSTDSGLTAILRNADTQTTIPLAGTSNISNTFFRATINYTGTTLEFYINDVLVGTQTDLTNMPTSQLSIGQFFLANGETVAKTITVDYCAVYGDR